MNRVANTVMVSWSEYDELRIGHARYEYLRTLTPVEFKKIWERGMKENIRWDDLIDQERRKRKAEQRGCL
jgi:hypothetical protein